MRTQVFYFLLLLALSSTATAQVFTGSFDLVVAQQYPNGNVRTDTVSYFFTPKRIAMILHGRGKESDMRMIFDNDTEEIVVLFLLDGKKLGYTLPMDEAHWPGMPHALKSPPKTLPLATSGSEKEIEGRKTREVRSENDDYVATVWIDIDIPLSMTQVLSYQSVGKGKSKKEIELFNQLGVSGFPLEVLLKSKKGKADVQLKVINLSTNVDAAVFSSEGYTVSKME
ncbi:DUF4412 domain-containing protein [Altibacter lentus]|uniref:DUF4412 domain-containing protein n=1 Tax=Altibacter lentus TaxID=1223410 RepID=UPI001267D49C|nr:DUF4412 domain-containing protein [Altibacter lentus]